LFLLFLGVLVFFVRADSSPSLASQDTLVKHASPNEDIYRDASGSFKSVISSGEVNFLKDGKYVPYNLTLSATNFSNYVYKLDADGVPFKVYLRENSNTAEAVRFEKDGYFFTYDLSGGQMQWVEKAGQPSASSTLGSGAPSNSQDSQVIIEKSKFSYPTAFYNTSVEYIVNKDMLKETFVLGGLPSIKDYFYLEYTGNIKFNKTLQICTENQCYIPHGTDDDFSTSGKIYFKDMNNNTIFYLKEPEIRDSAGHTTLGIYKVKGSDAQMQFSLRIPKVFLETAIYPIEIDPTVTYVANSTSGVYASGCVSSACTPAPSSAPPTEKPDALSTQGTSSVYNALSALDGIVASHTASYAYRFLRVNLTDITSNNASKFIKSINYSIAGYSDLVTGNGIQGYYFNYTSQTWKTCGSVITNGVALGSKLESCLVNSTESINQTNQQTYLLFQSKEAGAEILYIDYMNLEVTYDGIIINSPTSNQEILNSLSTTLNTSQAGYNQTIWYTWNLGIKNTTLCTQSNECQATITFPRQGYYNLTIYANKSDGTQTSKTVSNLFVGNVTKFNQGRDKDCGFNPCNNGTTIKLRGGVADNPDGLIYINISTLINATVKSSTLYTYGESQTNSPSFMWSIMNVNSTWGETDNIVPSVNLTIYYKQIIQTIGIWYNWYNLTEPTQFKINNPTLDYGFALECRNGDTYCPIVNKLFEMSALDSATASYRPYLNITYYSQNIAPTLTPTLTNNSNFSTSTINFTFNISDDNDYLTNISLFIDGNLNKTLFNQPITANTNNSLNFSVSGIADGTHTWYIQAYDSDNVQSNSSTFKILVDTIPPSLSIIHPPNGAGFTTGTRNLNYTVSDSGVGLSSCWYRNNTDATNKTITCGTNTTISQGSDGTYTVYMWANDTLNNVVSTSAIWTVSATAPALTLIYPPDAFWVNNGTSRYVNFTAIDSNGIDTCEYWFNSTTKAWHKNQTKTFAGDLSVDAREGFFIQNLSDSNYIWNIWCNDTTGLAGTSSFATLNRTFHIDTIYPQINLTYPLNTTYTSIPQSLNYSRSDLNLFSCWYSTNNGITNSTPDSSCNNFSISASQGSQTWTVYINDSANNQNSSKITFFVDSINPSILINTSFSNGSYLNYNSSIIFNLTISDTNLNSCWYTDNGGLNQSFTCGSNLSLNLSEELHTINIYANDTLNNINGSERISFIPDATYPIINITSITGTAGSQTINVYYNYTELNPSGCKYNIINSSGGIDVDNTTITSCALSFSSTVTIPAAQSPTFDVYVYVVDLAGNENFSIKSFTLTPLGVITPPSGGGGGLPENKTREWEMTTEANTKIYNFQMVRGASRTKNLNFVNTGTKVVNLKLSCNGSLCDYIKFQNNSVYLPIAREIATQIPFTLSLPDDLNFTSLTTNLIAIDSNNLQDIVTLDVRVSLLGTPIEILDKLSSSKVIYGIPIPYVVFSAFAGAIIFLIFNYLFFRSLKLGLALSIILAFLGSIGILVVI